VATPAFHNGGSDYRRRHGGYRSPGWGQTPAPTGNGWLGQVGAWLGGPIPSYAGQGQPTAVGNGSPVYQPAPLATGNSDAASMTAQPTPAVIMVPRS
jgi:hypothetical protein